MNVEARHIAGWWSGRPHQLAWSTYHLRDRSEKWDQRLMTDIEDAVTILNDPVCKSSIYVSMHGFPKGHPQDVQNVKVLAHTIFLDADLEGPGWGAKGYYHDFKLGKMDRATFKQKRDEAVPKALESMRKNVEILVDDHNFKVRTSLSAMKGGHIYLDFPPHYIKANTASALYSLILKRLFNRKRGFAFDTCNFNASRVVRLPNSINSKATAILFNNKTKTYCVPIEPWRLTSIETTKQYDEYCSEQKDLALPRHENKEFIDIFQSLKKEVEEYLKSDRKEGMAREHREAPKMVEYRALRASQGVKRAKDEVWKEFIRPCVLWLIDVKSKRENHLDWPTRTFMANELVQIKFEDGTKPAMQDLARAFINCSDYKAATSINHLEFAGAHDGGRGYTPWSCRTVWATLGAEACNRECNCPWRSRVVPREILLEEERETREKVATDIDQIRRDMYRRINHGTETDT